MSFTPDLGLTHKVVVGISDMAVANSSNVTLSTFALGSCVGVLGFDLHCRVAGLIHAMLPEAGNRRTGDKYSPYMFVDTGLPLLVKELTGFRALRNRMVFAIIGGASVNSTNTKSFFRIGEDNVSATRHFFRREGLKVIYEDTGGTVNRTVHFQIGEGLLTLKKPNGTTQIDLN
ncbi:MAG: chemotaxis protein CheD [Puniceicoccaceae bacterium]